MLRPEIVKSFEHLAHCLEKLEGSGLAPDQHGRRNQKFKIFDLRYCLKQHRRYPDSPGSPHLVVKGLFSRSVSRIGGARRFGFL